MVHNSDELNKYERVAENLIKKNNFDEYWIFIYEVLSLDKFQEMLDFLVTELTQIKAKISSNPTDKDDLQKQEKDKESLIQNLENFKKMKAQGINFT